MAALQCEICGGKLMGRPGGIFECDSCGMEYDTAWAKAKIQEIKGTVQVEGTVEVQGTVKVDGPVRVEGNVTADAMLQRGFMALKANEKEKADEFFERALDIQPRCSMAYLGKLLCKTDCKELSELEDIYTGTPKFELFSHWTYEKLIEMPQFQKALEFADGETQSLISGWNKKRAERLSRDIQQRMINVEVREKMRKFNAQMPQLVFPTDGDVSVLLPDGSVLSGKNVYGDTSRWRGIIQVLHVFASDDLLFTLGLREDGTVVATQKIRADYKAVLEWKDIKRLYNIKGCVFGLRKDGKVLLAGPEERMLPLFEIELWTDIQSITGNWNWIVGLTRYGTVMCVSIKGEGLKSGIDGLRDVKEITAGFSHTACLKEDGTVVVEGRFSGCREPQTIVARWSDIAAIRSGTDRLMGIRKDGTVVCVPEYSHCYTWRDVADGVVFRDTPIGITPDGTVLAENPIRDKYAGSVTLSGKNWEQIQMLYATDTVVIGLGKDGTLRFAEPPKKERFKNKGIYQARLFNRVETLAQDRMEMVRKLAEAKQRAAEKQRAEKLAKLKQEAGALQTELSNLKGLFTGKRRREIETRLTEIERELKGLS